MAESVYREIVLELVKDHAPAIYGNGKGGWITRTGKRIDGRTVRGLEKKGLVKVGSFYLHGPLKGWRRLYFIETAGE